jgi:hypothetical protein
MTEKKKRTYQYNKCDESAEGIIRRANTSTCAHHLHTTHPSIIHHNIIQHDDLMHRSESTQIVQLAYKGQGLSLSSASIDQTGKE